jgi:hypothetical protein
LRIIENKFIEILKEDILLIIKRVVIKEKLSKKEKGIDTFEGLIH